METDNVFVEREAWLKARLALLKEEKAFTRQRDALSQARRALPMVQVDQDYRFATERGQESLADLFKGTGQLIVYHFMFGADWQEGCPSCSFWLDNIDGVQSHLAARDTAFVSVSTAPLATLLTYKKRMRWSFDWVSCGSGPFNRDFGVTFPGGAPGPTDGYNYTGRVFGEEMPGISVFTRLDSGDIGHSYSCYARGLDMLNGAYHLLDLTPKGRDENDLEFTMAWVKRRDQY
ncbi:MAG: DUF899 domain-containing protein [Pseudomonadota bacterium]